MSRSKAIGSLVCGILAVFLWPLAIILGPIALFLGMHVVRRKLPGRGMAIAGIITANIGLVIFFGFLLLAYAGVIGPETSFAASPPRVIVDTGYQLSAGDIRATELSAGTYEFETSADDALTIITFASSKDYELAKAHGKGVEAYQECSATKSIRFHQTCTLRNGAVFAIENPNFLMSTNVNLKITKLR